MLPQGLEPDPDRALYLKRVSIHARLLVRHHKDRIKSWQIENEPNWWAEHVAGGWRSGLAWVYEHGFRHELLRTLNDAVHEEDASATTIINLEADPVALDPGAYSSYCDILGLDFYPNYKLSHPINTKALKAADQAAKKLSKPVMISETGYPSGPSLLGYSLDNQAKYVEEACRVAHGLNGVTGIGIWRYVDTAWRSFPPQENHFGLFDKKGNLKPAWTEFSKTIKELK
jgi:GH35 family endo-1,4-beta-xylanase